jgi:dephospho-CoA kinase
MVILGLTGSIGMGKSTAAAMFRKLGVPVHDADAEVHRVLARGGHAVGPVEAAFPGVAVDGAIDRAALRKRVFGDAQALARLEAIIHPMVADIRNRFLARGASRRVALVVLDIPLLFETGNDRYCDATVVVSAPRFLQEARVLARPGMTRQTLADILARQMPDREKRRRADFVVPSNLGRGETLRRLREIVRLLAQRKGAKWPPPPYLPIRGPIRRKPHA